MAHVAQWGNRCVALKELLPGKRAPTMDAKNAMNNEIVVLSSLDHRNVVKFLGGNIVQSFFFMELERGSLDSLMYDNSSTAADNRTPEFEWDAYGRKVLCDAASGLAYLHEKRIVHYDLKPQNVLVSDSFVGKLADVGSCKRLKSTETSKGAGTEDYQAPEARARNGKTNESSDIYSFGVMVWEVKKHRSSHTQFPAEPLIELCNWDGPTADVLCGVEGVHGGALAGCDYIQIVGRRTKQARWPGHESSQSLRRPTALELVAALNTLPQDDI